VTVRDVLTNSGYDDIHVGSEFFEKIREHVSINEVPKIEIDEISYPVNTMFMLFLTPHVSTTETTYRLAKNKKGGIKLQGLSNEVEMQLLPVLSENQQIALLGKGSYLITVATRTTRLRVTYFFPNKEEKVHNKVFIKKELLSVEPK
jgi:hypothetical protein